jgi:hypothetical protein
MPNPFQQRILSELAEAGHPIDVTGGGKLEEGGTTLADMFRSTTVKHGRAAMAWRMFQMMASAKQAFPVKALRDVSMLGGAFVREHHREPGDTDYLRGREPNRTAVIQDFVHRMMLPGSGFANSESAVNFQNAMEMHNAGQDITWEIVPHGSELDPVLIETILSNEGRRGSRQLRADTQQFLAETITVAGHKVRNSVFHRIFIGGVNSLSIYAPKYREGLNDKETILMNAYSDVVNRIMSGIHANARMMMMRCPEGGRVTPDREIGFYGAVEPPPAKFVPLHLEMPQNFMGIEQVHAPAVVKLFVGEPVQAQGNGLNDRANNRVRATYDSLARVHADVDSYAWCIKRLVKKRDEPVDRAKGAPEMFRVLIPKKSEPRRRGR